MGKLVHGMPVPSPYQFLEDAEDAILLEYEEAFIAANGHDPELRKLENGQWKIDSIQTADASFFVFEFPWMTKTLWERAEYASGKQRTTALTILAKRLMPIRLADILEKLRG